MIETTTKPPLHGQQESDGVAMACRSLCACLHDGIDIHRCQAARSLGRIGDRRAAPDLIAALLDEDEDVRADAAAALVGMAPANAAAPILDSLIGDPSAEVKMAAIDALARLNDDAAVPWLRRLVRSRTEEVAWDEDAFYQDGWDDWTDIQMAALKALSAMGREEAVGDMVHAIADPDGQDLTEVGFGALARLGGAGAEALANFVDDTDPRLRRRAVAAAVNAEEPAAEACIGRALTDGDVGVRLAAAASAAARDAADGRLEALFEDGSAEVRVAAIHLCGAHFPDRVAALTKFRKIPVRRAAFRCLDETPYLLAPGRLKLIANAGLASNDPVIASHAISILAQCGDAGDRLKAIVLDGSLDARVRAAALRGLATSGADAAVVAAAILGDDERQVRIEAMSVLTGLAETGDWPNRAGETLLSALARTGVGAETPDVPEAEEPKEVGPDDPAPVSSTLDAIVAANRPSGPAVPDMDAEVRLTPSDLEFLEFAKRSSAKRVVRTANVPAHRDIPRLAARFLGDIARVDIALALADRLMDTDTEMRTAAADSLARIGEALGGLPEVIVEKARAMADHAEAKVRFGAVRALGMSGAGAAGMALPTLRSSLADPEPLVRAEAVAALARLHESGAWPEPLLDDANPAVRLAAARALAEGADGAESGTVERLVDFAFSHAGHHRRAAARLLRSFDREAAARAFCTVLGDEGRVQEWPIAMEALEELVAPPMA